LPRYAEGLRLAAGWPHRRARRQSMTSSSTHTMQTRDGMPGAAPTSTVRNPVGEAVTSPGLSPSSMRSPTVFSSVLRSPRPGSLAGETAGQREHGAKLLYVKKRSASRSTSAAGPSRRAGSTDASARLSSGPNRVHR
jgi:hypothetical protein